MQCARYPCLHIALQKHACPHTKQHTQYLRLALVQASFLHQPDEGGAILVADGHVAAAGDELHHLSVAQQCGVHQLLPELELKGGLVHALHGLQQLDLGPDRKQHWLQWDIASPVSFLAKIRGLSFERNL